MQADFAEEGLIGLSHAAKGGYSEKQRVRNAKRGRLKGQKAVQREVESSNWNEQKRASQLSISLSSNPQLSPSTSFLRVHVLSLLNYQIN
ncbi:MAG: hypothetical protein KH188_11025 [Prevotella sp.]|nr:hypothetical protein [Prevotella sp.]